MVAIVLRSLYVADEAGNVQVVHAVLAAECAWNGFGFALGTTLVARRCPLHSTYRSDNRHSVQVGLK